ncbi:MAG: DUF512 domain-containing protein [Lachnospiraceae bacterium]|nr:DUF512 domain-containing protein [Lachnospiraceae bacterium]
MKKHRITGVQPGSIAEELSVEPEDLLLKINDREILDYFDYAFFAQETELSVLIEKPDGEEWLLEIEKDEDEDLGLCFENDMMDAYRSCANRCIFCFIDQMPPGMRENLYFKDDDARLSFLHGNYVTLTNMSDRDIDRIISYHMSPVYISFQTMNEELRCQMLGNRFAGEALKKADRLFEAGIEMNGQIVLCKNYNDGDELTYSIERLSRYAPLLQSVSVVPVGLTRYREGLTPLMPFSKEDAGRVVDLIEAWQERMFSEYGYHFIHASDEWYLLAERPLPSAETYDGYLQYENGVGMLRSLLDDFEEAFACLMKKPPVFSEERTVSIATGLLSYETIHAMGERLMKEIRNLRIHVYPIRNDFFGSTITVTGLLTGQDIRAQLSDKPLGDTLLLSETMVRTLTGGENAVFLDDVTVADLESALQVPVNIVKSNGWDFVEKILNMSN